MSRSVDVRPLRLPGFGLSLGIALTTLGVVVLLPVAALVLRASELSLGGFVDLLLEPRCLAALRLSVGTSFAAALINTGLGLLVAWVLVRYPFPGRRLVDALVDLPFALPTSVAGITLTMLWVEHGALGSVAARLGLPVAFTPLGVVLALVFVGFPFTVRTVQPVIAALDTEPEEAARSLGATRSQTFVKVVLPLLWPAIITGFTLAFARGLGEYGSVVFIAGNLPGQTEIAPLLVVARLEQYDYLGAAALGLSLVLMSLALLVLASLVERRARRLAGGAP